MVTTARRRHGVGFGSGVAFLALIGACLISAAPATAAPVAQTFGSTGALQQFTVPAGVCGLAIIGTGGAGGAAGSVAGGRGAKVSAHVQVVPGATLQILVGSAGGSGSGASISPGGHGGFGGGGGGGVLGSGGGGGASVVFDSSGPLVVAGAGGGGSKGLGATPGGNAGVLGSVAGDGVSSGGFAGGTGGTPNGVGGTGPLNTSGIPMTSAGGGGGVVTGGASADGGVGGDGAGGFGGGGGASSAVGDVHAGQAAGPGESGIGGTGQSISGSSFGGDGGNGTVGGGDGGDSPTTNFNEAAGGGGGGAGFGGGGGGTAGGGGGAGYGAGGGGLSGGGGGSSWVVPGATLVGSKLASTAGDGSVTIRYDSVSDACAVVVPGSGTVTAPDSGTADLSLAVTLSAPSTQPVTVDWTTELVPGAPDNTVLGHQAPTTDYVPARGTVTFAPGDTTGQVHIAVTAGTFSPDEYIVVSFTDPTNARIGGLYGLGFGVILAAP